MVVAFRASPSVCSVISLDSGMCTGVLESGCRTLTHAGLGFPFHFSPIVRKNTGILYLRVFCLSKNPEYLPAALLFFPAAEQRWA